jgi:hypothetical protein
MCVDCRLSGNVRLRAIYLSNPKLGLASLTFDKKVRLPRYVTFVNCYKLDGPIRAGIHQASVCASWAGVRVASKIAVSSCHCHYLRDLLS